LASLRETLSVPVYSGWGLAKSLKQRIFVAAGKIQIEGIMMVKDLICFCFEYSADDINQDYLENGKSTIMEKIQQEKKFGNCRCATMNPKGK
jgi:hypothetical protein